ncbi:hypothetical protein [Nostoc sp.]|uniref:hypothetical protein n=1 Tax=Nostoc sp. TaxID=1180 RepID=UPI002FF96B85
MNSDITIGYVCTDLQSLHDWTNHQFGMKSMSSSRVAFDRTHKWFGYEVILLKPNAKIKKGHWDARVTALPAAMRYILKAESYERKGQEEKLYCIA